MKYIDPHIHCVSRTTDDYLYMARAGVVAVSLPLAGLYLDQAPLPARALVDAGVPVAVATDFNPGSAPSAHLPLALTLACVRQRLTPTEALKGATLYAARAVALGALLPAGREDPHLRRRGGQGVDPVASTGRRGDRGHVDLPAVRGDAELLAEFRPG